MHAVRLRTAKAFVMAFAVPMALAGATPDADHPEPSHDDHHVMLAVATGVLMATVGAMALRNHVLRRKMADLSTVNASLRRTEKQLGLSRFILDKSANAVYLIDEAGYITYANGRAVTMSGYSMEQLLTKRVYGDLNPDFSYKDWGTRWQRTLALPEGEFLVFRTRQRHRDGTIFPIEVTAHLIEHEGRPYNLSMVLDITERVRAEKELTQMASLSDRALELTRSGYWSVPLDNSGYFTPSERTAAIIGLPAASPPRYPLSLWVDAMNAVDPALSKETFAKFNQACAGETPIYEAMFPFKRPIDGRVVWLHSLGVVVNDPDRPHPEMHGVVQDITDVVEARRELESARRAAEQANRLKSEFLANMSHEIRTPMNAILGYAQLIRSDPALSKEQLARIEPINRAGEHLLALINDILEMSKIEAGRVTLNESAFDLHGLLDGLIEVYDARAKAKGISLTLERTPDLPHAIVSDEAKLRQALLNLVGNAVKFTNKGGIVVSARAVHDEGNGHTLRFSVADTGPGIPEDELKKLFRPFVQSTAGISSGGTGLGLAISRQYARLLGGDITVVSESGCGSTFTFTMHARPAKTDEAEKRPVLPRVLRLAEGQSPVRILVADDVELNRDVISTLLTPMGFETRTAANGKEAIAVFSEWKPHAVLMDMRMPVMDGYEATRQIKASPSGRATFILALTASAFEEDRSTVLASGVDDFMRKPFKIDELLAVIGARLNLRYVYEDTVASGAVEPVEIAAASTADYSEVPEPLQSDLLKACGEADYEKLIELCDQLAGSNPAAADRFRVHVNAFDYESIARELASNS